MSENECELKMVLHLTDQIKERFCCCFNHKTVTFTKRTKTHFLAADLADAFVNSFRRPLQGNT